MKNNNLLLRTATGICFVAVVVSCILFSYYSYAILFTVFCALSIWEFCTLVNKKENVNVNCFINIISGIYLFYSFFGFCKNEVGSYIFIPYLILIIYSIVSEIYRKHKDPIETWAHTMLAQIYVALPFALLNVIAFQIVAGSNGEIAYHPTLLLSIFIFIWLNDTGAYCIGSLIGKHKLFPRISPMKSWEGSIGGGILVIIVALIFSHFFNDMSVAGWLGFGLVIVVFGTLGDLVESLFKRTLGIKDSGNILPGHGGMLDRFDSAIIAIPAVIVYLYTLSLFA
jgi:phosphatidate cytidylyltransferase